MIAVLHGPDGRIHECRRFGHQVEPPAIAGGWAWLAVDQFAADYDRTHQVVDGILTLRDSAVLAAEAAAEQILDLKRRRNMALADSAWTQAADAPLSLACIAAYRDWRVQLHRWLVDHPDGQTPLPEAPPLTFLSLDQQV
jgi:hypothetical protein